MFKFFSYSLSGIGWLWSHLYTYGISKKFKSLRDVCYSVWIRRFLGEMPLDSSIAYPCSLQGEGGKYIYVGHNTFIQGHSILGCWRRFGDQVFASSIVMGDNCTIGEYNQITACNKITIGNGLLTGRYVYIGDNAHGGLSWEESSIPPSQRELRSKGEIVIGDNVWIGDKVSILSGVTIGDNVIIGANSVVTHDLQSNCVAVGIPAKVIKTLGTKS